MKASGNYNGVRKRNHSPKKAPGEKYILRLYISGVTARSTRAILNLKALCNEYLPGRFQLDVIDIYQQPELAKDEQIVAAPTLIKTLPLPLRRFIGDMSRSDRLLLGLGLSPARPPGYAPENDDKDRTTIGDPRGF